MIGIKIFVAGDVNEDELAPLCNAGFAIEKRIKNVSWRISRKRRRIGNDFHKCEVMKIIETDLPPEK